MAAFMGYEVGGMATSSGDLFAYEVVDSASSGQSLSGDDIALLHGIGGAFEFINGRFRGTTDGEACSLRSQNDYVVSSGRWVKVG